jgi:hypothetical protein
MADLTTPRCERCGRPFPGVSRTALKRTLVRGAVLTGLITALAAFAMVG